MFNGGVLTFLSGGVFVIILELLLIEGFVDSVRAAVDQFLAIVPGWL